MVEYRRIIHFHTNPRNVGYSACGTKIAGQKGWDYRVTQNWAEVTCKRCHSTVPYHKAKEAAMSTETVGIPTQTGSEDQTPKVDWAEEARAIGQRVPQSNTFDSHEPLIHAQLGGGNPMPLCTNNDEAKWTEGYSTMDGGAVTCRYCLQDPLFIQRNNMFTEMMSPSHGEGEAEPAAIVHDREQEDDYGTPLYNHDCEACKYLGHVNMHDLYWCHQGGGPNISTVIARFGDNGPDYISGIGHARDNSWLALAVVRAFRAGLLNDTDLSWL